MSDADRPDEVRLKVFLPREDPPSVHWIWKSADFQERESLICTAFLRRTSEFKAVMMPEDWSLRKITSLLTSTSCRKLIKMSGE